MTAIYILCYFLMAIGTLEIANIVAKEVLDTWFGELWGTVILALVWPVTVCVFLFKLVGGFDNE